MTTYRVGTHYGIHVYQGERPVATFHDADEAARFVAAMNDAQTVDVRADAGLRSALRDYVEREPCDEEMWSLDYFKHGQVDPYWMRCDKAGPHDEHENSDTGAHWPVARANPETDR